MNEIELTVYAPHEDADSGESVVWNGKLGDLYPPLNYDLYIFVADLAGVIDEIEIHVKTNN